MCTEEGTWYPEKPQCLGVQCKSPYGDNITILSEHNYEDININQSTFDVGTQLQIVCNKENNVKEKIILNCQANGIKQNNFFYNYYNLAISVSKPKLYSVRLKVLHLRNKIFF